MNGRSSRAVTVKNLLRLFQLCRGGRIILLEEQRHDPCAMSPAAEGASWLVNATTETRSSGNTTLSLKQILEFPTV
jgi:hypothetical protein